MTRNSSVLLKNSLAIDSFNLAPKMSDPKAGTSGMQEATSDNESDDLVLVRNRKNN